MPDSSSRRLVCVRQSTRDRVGLSRTLTIITLWGALGIGCDKVPELPLLEAREWTATNSEVGAALELDIAPLFRIDGQNGDRLYMTTEKDDAVYVYEGSESRLTLSSREAWDRASGSIGSSCGSRGRRINGIGLNIEERRLVANGERVKTSGNVVLTYWASPDENYLAVLSAKDRWRLPRLFPALGGGPGPPSGQYYHELFEVPGFGRVGNAVPLAITWGNGLQTCWSPDGGFVVYMDAWEPKMVVVPVQKP